MANEARDPLWALMPVLFRPHPWHGIPIGEDAPAKVTVYIEIVPTDTVKYELDKETGYLKVDRPQKYSNIIPTLYGFIPQTYCGQKTAEFCEQRTGRTSMKGDGDPLDICVFTEKSIPRGDLLLHAIPIGGLRMIDGAEADDKILAVMEKDAVYGGWRDVGDCPSALIDRLKHYFLTYKDAPGAAERQTEITHVYGREEAFEVIRASQADYHASFGNLEELLTAALRS
jgi:inorganic pyrophosphatase